MKKINRRVMSGLGFALAGVASVALVTAIIVVATQDETVSTAVETTSRVVTPTTAVKAPVAANKTAEKRASGLPAAPTAEKVPQSPSSPATKNGPGPGTVNRVPIVGIEVIGLGSQSVRIEGDNLVTSGPANIRFTTNDVGGDSEPGNVGATDTSSMPNKMVIDRSGRCADSTRIRVETDESGQAWLVREGCANVTFEDDTAAD
ncbi:MAG: hypothetical protein V1738_05665 [Patescibacteria group bacterium]